MLSSGTQAADFIKALYSELKSANMSNIAIACYDAEGWNDRKSMISQIKSPGAESMLGIVTSHTYTSNFNGPISTTEKVLQMEHSDLIGGWTTAWYSSGSSGDGQAWASAVHNGLVNNNLSGYLYRVATRGGSTNEKLIQTSATGYSVSKRLWALAQFSRFIRPNAARVGVNGAPSALSTSAFLNSADAEVYAGALVVPALNTGSAAQSVTVSSKGFHGSAVTAWVTSQSQAMEALSGGVWEPMGRLWLVGGRDVRGMYLLESRS